MKFDTLQIYNRNYSDIRLGLIDLYICEETNKIYAEKKFKFVNKQNFQKHLNFYQQRLEIKNIPIQQILMCQNDIDKLEIKIMFDYPQNDLFDFYEDLQNVEKLEIFLIQALQAINYLEKVGQVHGNVRHEFFQYQKATENFQLIDNFDNQRYSKDKAKDNLEDLIFLSPQYFDSIVNNVKFEGSLVKEDIFCLGLITLYLLCDIDDIISIFDFDNKKFDSLKLKQIKSQIKFQSNQAHLETLIKDHLLCVNEEERINSQEAFEILLKKNNKSIANYSFDYSKKWVQELQGSDTTYIKKSLRSINNLNKFSFNKDKDDSLQKFDKKQIEQNYLSYKYIQDKKDKDICELQQNLRSLNNLQETVNKSQQQSQKDSENQIGVLIPQDLKPDSKKFDKYSFGYFSQNLSENKQSKASDLMASKLDQQDHQSNKKTFQNESLKDQSKEQIFRSTVQQKQTDLDQIKDFDLNQNDNLLSSDISQDNEEKLFRNQDLELILKESDCIQSNKKSKINKSSLNDLSQINKSSLNDIEQSQNKQSISQDTKNNNEYKIQINYGLLSEEPSDKGVKQNQQNTIIQNYPKKNLLTHEFENMDLLSMDKSESDIQKKRFRESEVKSFQQMQQMQKAPLLDTQFYEDDTIKQSKMKKTLGFGRNKNSKRSQFFDHQIETGGESYLDGSMSIIVNKNISKMGIHKNSEQRFQAMNKIVSRENSVSQIHNDSIRDLSYTPTNNSIKEEDMESQIDDPQDLDLDLTSNNNSSIQPQKKISNPTRNLDQHFLKQIPRKRMSENVQMVQRIQIFQRPSRKSAMNNLLQKEVNSLKSSFSNLELDDIGNTLFSTKKDFDYQHLQKDIDKFVRDYFSEQQQISRADSKIIQNRILDQIIDKNPFKRRRSSKQLQQIKLMVNSRVNVELVHKKKFSLKESSTQLRPRIDTIKEESLDINASDLRPKTNRFKFVEQIDKELKDGKNNNFQILTNKKKKCNDILQQNLQDFIQQEYKKKMDNSNQILKFVKNICLQNNCYQNVLNKYIKYKQKFFILNKKLIQGLKNLEQNVLKIDQMIIKLREVKQKIPLDNIINKTNEFSVDKYHIIKQKSLQNKKIDISRDLNIIMQQKYSQNKQYQKDINYYQIFMNKKQKQNRKIQDLIYFKSQQINFCNFQYYDSQVSQCSESIDQARYNILQKKYKKNYQTFSSQIIQIKSSLNSSIKQLDNDFKINKKQSQVYYQQSQFSPLNSCVRIQTQSYQPIQFQDYAQNNYKSYGHTNQAHKPLNFRRIRNQQQNITQQSNILPLKKNKLKVSGFEKRSTQKSNLKKFQLNKLSSNSEYLKLQNILLMQIKIQKHFLNVNSKQKLTKLFQLSMDQELNEKSTFSGYLDKMHSELKIYSNLPCILEKVAHEGIIDALALQFEEIISKEMIYAVSGILKRTQKTQREQFIFGFQKSTHIKLSDLQRKFKDHLLNFEQFKKQNKFGKKKLKVKKFKKRFKILQNELTKGIFQKSKNLKMNIFKLLIYILLIKLIVLLTLKSKIYQIRSEIIVKFQIKQIFLLQVVKNIVKISFKMLKKNKIFNLIFLIVIKIFQRDQSLWKQILNKLQKLLQRKALQERLVMI